MKKQLIINITSWIGISHGAIHYYAKLNIVKSTLPIQILAEDWLDFKSETVELKRTIDETEAKSLNIKDTTTRNKAGMSTIRFNSIDEIKEATEKYMLDNNLKVNVAFLEDNEPINGGTYIINIKEKTVTTNKKIKITMPDEMGPMGPQFANLAKGTIHVVIETPEQYKRDELDPDKFTQMGVWVMGVGEPVKVLNREFMYIN